MEVLYGLHPVEEALKAGRRRFDHVLVASGRHDDRLARLVADCRQAGIRVRQERREHLTQLAGTPTHQGVLAVVRPREFLALEDLFEPAADQSAAPRLLLALDGVEDPQNLGALLIVFWSPRRSVTSWPSSGSRPWSKPMMGSRLQKSI